MTGVARAYAGWALVDRGQVMDDLMFNGVLPVLPVLVCDHVTHERPAAAAPPMADVRVIGVIADSRVHALIVTVDGTVYRPDGKIYHVTHGLAPGVPPGDSDRLLLSCSSWCVLADPFRVAVRPFLRRLTT